MKQCPVCKTEVQDDVTLCPLRHTRVTSPITAQQIFYKKSFNPGILRVDLGMLQRKLLALPAESYHIDQLPPWLINGLH